MFYERDDVKTMFQELRGGLPTTFVRKNISELYAHRTYNSSWTHPYHVPTKDLGVVWASKVGLPPPFRQRCGYPPSPAAKPVGRFPTVPPSPKGMK